MIRIQRRRTRGWRMPEGAVYVGRPSRWGNPFRVGTRPGEHTLETSLALYRIHAADSRRGWDWLDPLRQATALVCWCPLDVPCHADVLIELVAETGA